MQSLKRKVRRTIVRSGIALFAFLAAAACLPEPECAAADTTCNPVALVAMLTALSTTADPGVPRWVLVGAGGVIFLSSDGVTWQDVSPAGALDLFGVAYGAAGFVAVGQSGRVVTSRTGAAGTWQEQTTGVGDDLFAIAYDSRTGLYAAVGGALTTSDLILTSNDGVAWVNRSQALADQFNGITHTDNEFVAVGRSGILAESADGASWTTRISGAQNWRAVAFGNGILLANDGSNNLHTAASQAGLPNAVGTHGSANLESAVFHSSTGLFFLGGDDGFIYSSNNGIGAATATSAATIEVRWGLITDGTRIVATGSNGELATSPDGVTWTVSTITGADLYNGVFGRVPTALVAGQ